MKALFVAYQDTVSRTWTPVARLTHDGKYYHFSYTRGAKNLPDFVPFGRMNELDAEYVSEEIFPLFKNRLLPKSRPEYKDYLNWLGLSGVSHDVLEELGRTGGLRATDSLELIPCPEPTSSNQYEVYFFCRGLRHMSADSQARSLALVKGEQLYLTKDIQNVSDGMALILRTEEPVTLVGYVPRYYSAEFSRLIDLVGADAPKVTVEKVNADAPVQYRVLCKFSAPWPVQFQPCQAGLYEVDSALHSTSSN
jgi:hypothetical protein